MNEDYMLPVLMFFLGVGITLMLCHYFGDADALPESYYTYKGNGIFTYGSQVIDATEDCNPWVYGYSACKRTNVILLQNEKIIDLLEEIKNATRG